MERQTQCTRRSLRQVRTRLPAKLQITCVLLALCLLPGAVEGHRDRCDSITTDHMRALEELINNQALNACNVTFTFMTLPDRDADYRHKACYVRAATSSVIEILDNQMKIYKSISMNHKNAGNLSNLLAELRKEQCIKRIRKEDAKRCYRTFTRSPVDMLTMVEDFFNLAKEVLPIDITGDTCDKLYATCEEPAKDDHPKNEAATTPGPDQCKCSCPTPGSTSSTFASIAASPEAIGIKKPTPTQFMLSASRQGGARVARTLQYLPATPDSLQAPDTPRTPTVSTSQSTVVTEALFITDALEPTRRGTRRPPGVVLGSQKTFTPGSVTEKRLFGSTEEPVSETTGTADDQPSTEDIIIGSTEGPVSVTKEIAPHRLSTEEDIIGSTKGLVSVTTETAARQPPTENNLIGRPEGHLSLTTDTDTYQMSTKDSFIGSTEGPMPMTTQTAIHHMSKEDTRSTEDPLSLTTETTAHPLSTEVNLIGTTKAPMFVTEHLIQQASSEKENALHTTDIVSVAAKATPLRSSSHDESSGHSEVPKSVIDWHKSNALDTPKTERPTTFPSTSLIPEDSTRAMPEPDTGRGTSEVRERHSTPGVFQYRREGTLQSDRKGSGSDGTSHDSNFLPLYGSGSGRNQKGDQEESDRRVHIYVVAPCVVGILVSLCALLYYRRQNQILRRELQQAVRRSERQEEGPLQRLRRNELEMEMEMDEV